MESQENSREEITDREQWTEITIGETIPGVVPAEPKDLPSLVLSDSSNASERIPAVSTADESGSYCDCRSLRAVRDMVHRTLESKLGSVGYFIGSHPWYTLLLCCLIALALSTGCLFIQVETRSDVLWSPDNTLAKQNRDYVKSVYPRSYSVHQFVLTSYPQGKNVLTPEGLQIAAKVDRMIKTIKVPSLADSTEVQTYADLCYKNGIACWHLSVLQITGRTSAVLSNQKRILEKLNQAIASIQGVLPVRLEDVLGGVSVNSTNYITEAQAAAFTYFIRNQDEEGQDAEQTALQWEDEYLELLSNVQDQMRQEGFQLDWIGATSFDREIENTVKSETWMLYIAVFLIACYTILMLSKWSNGFVGTRAILSLCGIAGIGLAIGASVGACVYIGITYSQVIGLVPFLILGIGVDNMFILVNSFDRIDKDLKIENKISSVLATSGTSITLTSLTNCFAFVIGAQTSLPALRSFSIYAATGVLSNFILQMTLFPALLAIDGNRQVSERYDVLFCMKKSTRTDVLEPYISVLGIVDKTISSVMHSVGSQLSKQWIKPIILGLFGALAGIGIWGSLNIEVYYDAANFVPTVSHINSYEETRKLYFPTVGDRTALYLRDVNFSSPQSCREVNDTFQAFSEDPSIESESLISWFRSYQQYIESSSSRRLSPKNVTTSIQSWLKEEVALSGGSAFVDDVVFSDDFSFIKSCKFHGNHKRLETEKDRVRAMDSVRQSISSLNNEVSKRAFVYGDKYLAYEMFKLIGKEALRNISFGLVMIFTVGFLLLMDLKATILTWINIALVLVELLGLLYIWGYELDTTLTIFLVASMGLAVDYSAHLVHAFLKASGKTEDRILVAMGTVGPAITNAAMSTLCAVCILALSDSFVFKLFFRAFFLCVVLSMIHALILLPACLSLFPSWNDDDEGKHVLNPSHSDIDSQQNYSQSQ